MTPAPITIPSTAPTIPGAPDMIVAPKRPWYSRQLWLNAGMILLPFVPQIAGALGTPGKWTVIAGGVANAVLRVISPRPISFKP